MAFVPFATKLFRSSPSVHSHTRATSFVPVFVRPVVSPPRRCATMPFSPTVTASASPIPLSAGVGTSTATETSAALANALATATASLPGPPTAVLLTATVSHDAEQSLLPALADRLPGIPVHGATTCAAALTNEGPVASPALSILALYAPGGLAVSARPAADPDSVAAAAAELTEKLGVAPAHVIVHATPGTEEGVINTLNTALPNIPIFGGSAADDAVAGGWRLICTDAIHSEGVSLLGIAPGVRFGAALVPPYEPTSVSAVVTKASGRTIFELDGKPAGSVLREWVGDSVDTQAREGGGVIVECAGFPLGVERVSGGFVGIHAAEIGTDGSVGLFAEVAEGDKLTVMSRVGGGDSADAAARGLEMAYDQAMKKGDLSQPKAGLMIYCGGLSIAVGDGLAKSLEVMKDKAPMLGITAFGEQGNLNGCNVHSNLAVGVALFE